ncbi:MAG: tetratricopeptide repeat protein [Lysobacteraceae bacterium]
MINRHAGDGRGRMKRRLVLMLMASVACCVANAGIPAKQSSEAKVDDQDLVAQNAMLMEARRAIDAGKKVDSLPTIDKVIAHYESKYPESDKRWFVARNPSESLAYMVMVAADSDKGVDKRDAVALYTTAWSDAYYMKGFVLVDLGKSVEAMQAFEHAVALSPYNSQYLAELGNLYQSEKNWPKALELYKAAEDGATFTPASQQVDDSTRAKRGIGYVLVELGQFDEAEKKYEECIALNAHDDKAKQELEYVRSIRSKSVDRK